MPNKEYLQKINELQMQSEKALNIVLDNTDSTFDNKYAEIKYFDNLFIKKMNWEDSLQRVLMIKFSDFKHTLKKYPEAKGEAVRLAHLSVSQLNNLKSDFENGLLKKEEFEKYYQQEKDAIEELNNTIANIQFQQKIISNTYKELVPIMKTIKDTANINQ